MKRLARLAWLCAPVLVLSAPLVWVALRRERLESCPLLGFAWLADRTLFECAFYLAMVGLLARLPAYPLWPGLAAVAWIVFATDDVFVYHFNDTFFERQMLEFANDAYLGSFLGGDTYVILGAAALAIAAALVSLRGLRSRLSWQGALVCAVLAATVAVAAPARRLGDALAAGRAGAAACAELNRRLAYVAQNSLLNFLDEMLLRGLPAAHTTSELGELRRAVRRLGLPLGPRELPDLRLARFTRVVLLTSESISLAALHPYNREIPAGLTPSYGGEAVRERMFTNYWTSRSPTLPGLLTTFNSHPDPWLCAASKSPNSFVKVLARAGYRTIMLRGDPKHFASGHVHYPAAGFQRDLAREDFAAAGVDPRYLAEWGVFDRVLFDRVVEELKAADGRPTFISVLTVDTHPWEGRRDYADLDVPELPAALAAIPDAHVRGWLRAVCYHDHEVGRLLARLQREGLWDERTLLVLSADHACPRNPVVDRIPGYHEPSLARIPCAFLTPARLPPPAHERLGCQLDLGPTLLHLLGLPVPAGAWGESLFVRSQCPCVQVFREHLSLRWPDGRVLVEDLDDPGDPDLARLYGVILVDGGG